MSIDGLLQGSFKGVPFFLNASSRTGGRKTAFHNFPNSDVTRAEDMGRAPLSFTLDMIIAGPIDQGGKLLERYYNRRNSFISKLEDAGEGELIHPFWGLFNVQVDGEYTLVEDLGSIGRAVISQKFTQVTINKDISKDGNSNFFPSITTKEATRRELEQLEIIIQKFIRDKADEALIISNIDAAEALRADKEAVADNFTIISRNIEDAENLGEFNADINRFRNNPISEFSNDIDAIIGLFFKAREFIIDSQIAYNSFRIFWDFNDDITTVGTTPQLADVLHNELVYRSIMQSLSIGYATDSALNINFSTDIQLQEIESDIAAQLLKVSDNEVDNDEVFDSLQRIKVDSNIVFSNELLRVGRVISIDVVNSSMSNIVYSYYGNLNNYELIRDLNDFNNLSLINGSVKIVTEN